MTLKQKMIRQAVKRHGRIEPIKGKTSLDQCFNVTGSKIIFWFNVHIPDKSTRIVARDLSCEVSHD